MLTDYIWMVWYIFFFMSFYIFQIIYNENVTFIIKKKLKNNYYTLMALSLVITMNKALYHFLKIFKWQSLKPTYEVKFLFILLLILYQYYSLPLFSFNPGGRKGKKGRGWFYLHSNFKSLLFIIKKNFFNGF